MQSNTAFARRCVYIYIFLHIIFLKQYRQPETLKDGKNTSVARADISELMLQKYAISGSPTNH